MAKQYNRSDNPWIDPDYEPEMWRKTILRRLCKQVPKSAAMSVALALDDAADRGRQGLGSIRQAIDGDFAPVADEGEAPKGAATTDGPSLDEVARMIEHAKTADDIDAATGMIGHLSNDDQKEILRVAMEWKNGMKSA